MINWYQTNNKEKNKYKRTPSRFFKYVTIVLLIIIVLLIRQEFISLHWGYFYISAVVTLVFFTLTGHKIYKNYYTIYQRMTEHDILKYAIANNGVINTGEISLYTYESQQSILPVMNKWHKENLVSIVSLDDGVRLYQLPNCTGDNSGYRPITYYDNNPIFLANTFMMHMILNFIWAYICWIIGGCILALFEVPGIIIFCIGWIILYAGFVLIKAVEQHRLTEEEERLGVRLATQTGGILTVHELACALSITMEEAYRKLQKWEAEGVVLRLPQEDNIPIYRMGGVLSMEERLSAERV